MVNIMRAGGNLGHFLSKFEEKKRFLNKKRLAFFFVKNKPPILHFTKSEALKLLGKI
jgi:hypothetical protein